MNTTEPDEETPYIDLERTVLDLLDLLSRDLDTVGMVRDWPDPPTRDTDFDVRETYITGGCRGITIQYERVEPGEGNTIHMEESGGL